MTMTDEVAARYSVPEIVELDRQIAEHLRRHPSNSWDDSMNQAAYDAWEVECDRLVSQLTEAEAELERRFCTKCSGKGRILQFSHRSRGLCYRCNGSGWGGLNRKRRR